MSPRALLCRARVTAASLAVAAPLAGCAGDELDLGAMASAVDVDAFVLPALSAAERAQIVHRYDFLDPDDQIPRGLLEDALVYFDVNQAQIPRDEAFVVVDLSRYSGEDRFWLADLMTGDVEPHKVAHGDGSDPDNDGYATLFGNEDGSHMSSLGFYLTAEIYDGTHPHSMRLDGLSVDDSPNGMANTNVRDRLIVVHEASYVDDGDPGQQGRSNGCLALDPAIEADVVDRIHDGSLIYAAISPLDPPVGRGSCGDGTCDGAEDDASCPEDCDVCATGDEAGCFTAGGSVVGLLDEGDDGAATGGCSTSGGGAGGGAALVCAGALFALRRRRREATSTRAPLRLAPSTPGPIAG